MQPIVPAATTWSTLDPWTLGAVLIAMATLWWGLMLLRQIHERYDRILIGLVGLVAAYQGLHLAIETRGWAWFANALGVMVCLAAMSMLARLVHSHRSAEYALRLSEAREAPASWTESIMKGSVAPRADIPRAILESAPLAMFAVGLDGSVSFWNSTAERVLGWRSEEVLGHHMPDMICQGGDLFDGVPMKLVDRHGAEVVGPVQSVPIRDAKGAVSGILTIVTPNSL